MFKQWFPFVLLISLVTGCGFHLRGAFSIPDSFRVLQILPNQPYDALHKGLKQILKSNGVEMVDASLAKTKGAATLTILNQAFSERTIAYGSDGQINRANLKLSITYQLIDSNGKIISDNKVVQVERELTINPNAILSTDNERNRLKSDLYLEGALQIVRQLSILGQQRIEDEATKP